MAGGAGIGVLAASSKVSGGAGDGQEQEEEMSVLQGVIRSRPSSCKAAKVLREIRVPQGEQGREPEALAAEA